MRKVLLIFALLLLVVGIMLFAQNYSKIGSFPFKKNPTVTINGHNFKVNVAGSQKEREIGLSQIADLPQDQGMIFIFEKPAYYSFWMKNMKFPIDIIYINDDKIVTIKGKVQPPTSQEGSIIYTPSDPADKVLEINAGLSEKYNFTKGDKVKIDNL